MKYIFPSLAALCLSFCAHAQSIGYDSLVQQNVNEIIVTANKFEEKSRYVAQKVELVSAGEINASLSNNTASLLEQTGKVFVQKSQLGGGSPVLRGFEASRILLVIDGVRMNNAIYRTGHLQNVIIIDDDILEKAEILYGPASTVYGSDALGGVIHFRTRSPLLSADNNLLAKATGAVRYSSAYNEFTAHADVSLGTQRFASLTSVSYSSFGDLRQGNNRNPFYGDFGKRRQYIDRINGQDSIVSNKDLNIQKFSGYHQADLLEKLLWVPATGTRHELNIQYSTTSDIPRYDRLTDTRDGQLRWAAWYYGPQRRLMAAYTFTRENMGGFFDRLMLGINYQKIQESRMQRAYRKEALQSRIEDIHVAAFNADLRKSLGRNELNLGIDGQFNFLKSTAYNLDINSNERSYGLDSRYPDGKNSMHYAGAYVQHLLKIVPGRLILNDGMRINYVTLASTFKDTSILHLPFNEAKQKNITFSLNAGLIYLPDERSKISFGFSTGFRAPNIDDMAKVFESAGGSQLVVPNPDLKPEQTFNFDLNLNRGFDNGLTVEISGFYTLFRNAIVLDKFTLNGADAVIYNGELTPVVASQNKAKAWICGLQSSLNYRPLPSFGLYSTITYTYGRYKGADNTEVPMDHIPPVYGKTGLNYRYRFFDCDIFALYNGWKRVNNYNPYGEDNLQYATAEGMPAWLTLNISTGWTMGKHIKAQVSVENILDRNYRVFASGIHSAGRNLVLKLKAQF